MSTTSKQNATPATNQAAQKSTRHIRIFDTTLRDGEQSPGASMNITEKLEIAQALVDLGVDIIEAGFPIASPGDFEAVRQIATQIRIRVRFRIRIRIRIESGSSTRRCVTASNRRARA